METTPPVPNSSPDAASDRGAESAVSTPLAPVVRIPTRGERQALDWSLALASQDISCAIRSPGETPHWSLEVDPADAPRALRTLRLYHVENRGWRAAFAPVADHLAFHPGVLAWCFLLLVIFWASEAPDSRLEEVGAFATAATARGAWWRPITATFLHSGLDHLLANLATGFVLLGLAMARYGPGTALLVSLLAGAGGNLLAWAWRGHDYVGLGASGAVMGALGMLAISLVREARAHQIAPATVVRGGLGGVALFILIGTAPRSDVLAHAGGFLSGAIFGLPLAWKSTALDERRGLDLACALLYAGLGAAAWLVVLR